MEKQLSDIPQFEAADLLDSKSGSGSENKGGLQNEGVRTPLYEILTKGIVVRLHREKSEGSGIIVPKSRTITSDGGRQKTLNDDVFYLMKGTVVKLPKCHDLYTRTNENTTSLTNNEYEAFKDLKENDVVWLDPKTNLSQYAFFEKRNTSNVVNEDLVLLPYNLIQGIEITQ